MLRIAEVFSSVVLFCLLLINSFVSRLRVALDNISLHFISIKIHRCGFDQTALKKMYVSQPAKHHPDREGLPDSQTHSEWLFVELELSVCPQSQGGGIRVRRRRDCQWTAATLRQYSIWFIVVRYNLPILNNNNSSQPASQPATIHPPSDRPTGDLWSFLCEIKRRKIIISIRDTISVVVVVGDDGRTGTRYTSQLVSIVRHRPFMYIRELFRLLLGFDLEPLVAFWALLRVIRGQRAVGKQTSSGGCN